MSLLWRKIKYLVIDVDGTMTDAGVYYDDCGNEWKKFSTRDAAGFFALKEAGICSVVLTGRKCGATAKRMKELKADYVFQGVKDKLQFLRVFMAEHGLTKEQVGYIGDDINDWQPMHLAGLVACPADGCPEVKALADYVSPVCGGHGAVRDIIEHYLRLTGEWLPIIEKLYGAGI